MNMSAGTEKGSDNVVGLIPIGLGGEKPLNSNNNRAGYKRLVDT